MTSLVAILPHMIVGILSDTHGAVEAAKAGIAILREAGAEYFVHCGDVGSTDVLDQLAGLQAAFVYGNTDWNRDELKSYAAKLDISCLGERGVLILEDTRIAVMHGDDERAMKKIITDGSANYLLSGHTHLRDDRRIGSVHLINPGALYRTAVKSVAVLDTDTDTVRFLSLK